MKIFMLSWLVLSVFAEHQPKVYEEVNELVNENIRTIRQPTSQRNIRIYHPVPFNYKDSLQQDRLKSRYAQQQQVDLVHFMQKNKSIKTPAEQVNKDIIYKYVKNNSAIDNNYGHPDPRNIESREIKKDRIDVLTEIQSNEDNRKRRSSRKLHPSSYFEKVENNFDNENHKNDEQKFRINRQDYYQQPIIYVPNILKQNFGLDTETSQKILKNSYSGNAKPDNQIDALNDLIGKNPNVQLEGLKKLLDTTHIVPDLQGPEPFKPRDHTPITERTIDVPNLQMKPNIKTYQSGPPALQVNDNALAAIQAHLDATAKEHAEKVLGKATQDAYAHVEAQHKAIAAAKVHAENAALAEIAIQNSRYNIPQQLPYTENIVPIHAQQQLVPVVHKYPSPQSHPFAGSQSYHAAPLVHSDRPIYQQEVVENLVHDTTKTEIAAVEAEAIAQAEAVAQAQAAAEANILAQAQAAIQHQATLQAHSKKQQQEKAETIAKTESKQKHRTKTQSPSSRSQVLIHHQPVHYYSGQENSDESRHHSEKQIHAPANTYQEIILETQQKVENVKNVYSSPHAHVHSNDKNNDLQYAARYAFGYRIKDLKMGNDFGHEEKREGKSAKGHYHVLLPDGRLQKVEYYVDDDGYHAKVTYENLAHH